MREPGGPGQGGLFASRQNAIVWTVPPAGGPVGRLTMMLAMHMGNELLSVPVALGSIALAAGLLALAARRARKGFTADKVPLMGVLGAFVFAGQMINFQIPGLGTSGHLGGGALLAILLGPAAATLVMAAILIVQCLLFQDGGLLALGCNILNMGVVPCYLGYGVFRLVLGEACSSGWRVYLATWLASLLGLLAGAALVPLEATLSGVLRIPPGAFLSVMMLLHVPIGVVEGLITFAVIAYVYKVSPALLGPSADGGGAQLRAGRRAILVSLLAGALLIGGSLAWFASSLTDGLETALTERYIGTAEPLGEPAPLMERADEWSAAVAPMPDYGPRATEQAPDEQAWPDVSGWTSLAGVGGSVVTLGLVYCLARLLRRRNAQVVTA